MSAKVQNLKTKRQKTIDQRQFVGKLAEIFNVRPRYVNYILAGKKGHKSKKAENILVAADQLADGYAKIELELESRFNPKPAA